MINDSFFVKKTIDSFDFAIQILFTPLKFPDFRNNVTQFYKKTYIIKKKTQKYANCRPRTFNIIFNPTDIDDIIERVRPA